MSDQKTGLEKTEAIYSMYKYFEGRHAFAGAYRLKFDEEGKLVTTSGKNPDFDTKDRYEVASSSILTEMVKKIHAITEDEVLQESIAHNLVDRGFFYIRNAVGSQKIEEFNCNINEILSPFKKFDGAKKFAKNYSVDQGKACEILHGSSNVVSLFETNEVVLKLENCVKNNLIKPILKKRELT